MSFWQNVENELQYQNISRKELAARAGFAVSGISLGINNGNVPNAELAVKIADVLKPGVANGGFGRGVHFCNLFIKIESFIYFNIGKNLSQFLGNDGFN